MASKNAWLAWPDSVDPEMIHIGYRSNMSDATYLACTLHVDVFSDLMDLVAGKLSGTAVLQIAQLCSAEEPYEIRLEFRE